MIEVFYTIEPLNALLDDSNIKDADESSQRLIKELSKRCDEKVKKATCRNCGKQFNTISNKYCSSKCDEEQKDVAIKQIDDFKKNTQIINERDEIFKLNRELKKLVSAFLKEYNLQVRRNRRLVNKHNQSIGKLKLPEFFAESKYLSHSLYEESNHLEEILDYILHEQSLLEKSREQK